LFCDGAEVNAPVSGPLELVSGGDGWGAAKLATLKAQRFEIARSFPPGLIKRPPR
jgi:hypothetical protein